MAEQSATTPTTPSTRPGLTDGVVNEGTFIFTVKPGHQKQVREGLEKFLATPARNNPENLRRIGIHELRQVLFDDDSRFLMAVAFEGDWDKYIDDIIVGLGLDDINLWFKHLEGATPDITPAEMKEAFAANQITALGYKRTIPDAFVGETMDALRMQKAFQQVLDHPDAAKALEHPALAPLLELAAY